MSSVTRRDFLKSVALGGGTLVFIPIAKNFPVIFPDEPNQSAPLEDIFIEGIVGELKENELQVKDDKDDKIKYTIRITPSTRLWKGDLTTLDKVETGDFLYGLGTLVENGVIEVKKLWVNIVNFYVKATFDSDTWLNGQLLTLDGSPTENFFKIEIDDKTVVNESPGQKLVLGPDGLIQIIGLMRRDETVMATKIWTAG
ncbi:MAG: twin-arginine translocation signal domain-containing protein [Anaerolineales bacterium]|nr:twin-arginine translocation signal domain-containing protein [Anaerolineales bacterium]